MSNARRIAVLTGAGISAESGIPTFRGKNGLWRNFSATDLATPEAFANDPKIVWEWYSWRRDIISKAQPNAAHIALSKIENIVDDFLLITQNVDGLHQRAGSKRIIELHGNIWRVRCTAGCGTYVLDEIHELPPKCKCGALVRPDVVWFGESLERRTLLEAYDAARDCDLFLSIGTSSAVHPAAELPYIAKDGGAFVVEINPDTTPMSSIADLVISSKAGVALPEVFRVISSIHHDTKCL